MSAATFPLPPFHPLGPRAALRRAWSSDRPLTAVGLLMLVTLSATLVGLLIDDRVITGAPAWLKPTKFAVSIAIYTFTFVWLLGFVRGHRRLVGLVAWGTAATLLLEQILIVGQVVRGTTSHFNAATAFDTAVWNAMGMAITIAWVLNLLAAILLLRQRLPDPAFAWSLRLGVLVSFVGMGVAYFMAFASPEPTPAAEEGEILAVAGAHAVGVADGGAGLPIVGWSTEGGDLRVPHFVGLHALQLLPLVGWLLAAPRLVWLGPRRRLALVWIVGAAYLGLVLLLTWQARRGQSVTEPDALTLGALAAGLVVAGGATAGVVLGARRAVGR